jgi:hypothetical protein
LIDAARAAPVAITKYDRTVVVMVAVVLRTLAGDAERHAVRRNRDAARYLPEDI